MDRVEDSVDRGIGHKDVARGCEASRWISVHGGCWREHWYRYLSCPEKHPELPAGSLALQDLPEVIVNAQVDEKVTTMALDFFMLQPAMGEKNSIPPSLF